jgi:hypothetical protein
VTLCQKYVGEVAQMFQKKLHFIDGAGCRVLGVHAKMMLFVLCNVCERAEFFFSSWRQSTWDALRKYRIAYDFRAKKGSPYGSTLCQLHGSGQLQPKQPLELYFTQLGPL